MTEPLSGTLKQVLGADDAQIAKYLTPIDMSPHGDSVEEKMHAKQGVADMIDTLLEINQKRWDAYRDLKNAAINSGGPDFDIAKWELANTEKKPFVLENTPIELMSAMVVTVGFGTPMLLYQALEINIIQQKIFNSVHSPDGAKVAMTDLDSIDPTVRAAAYEKLHNQDIKYSSETIAKSFIQHPNEGYNRHYTCPRGQVVMVQGDNIRLGGDKDLSQLVLKTGQRQEINPEWISEKPLGNVCGNENASCWVAHFMATWEKDYEKRVANGNADAIDLKNIVDGYLTNPKNYEKVAEIIMDVERTSKAHIGNQEVKSMQTFIKEFHGSLRETVVSSQKANAHSSQPEPALNEPSTRRMNSSH